MLAAFIGGMAITASLALMPVSADILFPQPSNNPVIPALPDKFDSLKSGGSPDTGNKAKPWELVYITIKEGALSC